VDVVGVRLLNEKMKGRETRRRGGGMTKRRKRRNRRGMVHPRASWVGSREPRPECLEGRHRPTASEKWKLKGGSRTRGTSLGREEVRVRRKKGKCRRGREIGRRRRWIDIDVSNRQSRRRSPVRKEGERELLREGGREGD
jgi:hypothetical protein